MAQIGFAAHLVGGRLSDEFFWIGLTGGNIGDWYNWPDKNEPHRGFVRWGLNGDSYGVDNLRDQALAFWNNLLEEFQRAGLERAIEEIWFGPQFTHLGTMFRIRLMKASDRNKAYEAARKAAERVWPGVDIVDVPPMS